MLTSALIAVSVAAQIPPKPIEREYWFEQGDVPADVLRARKGGVVGFEIQVGESGKPTSCRVTVTSGFPSLDEATCAAVMSRANFEPARNEQGGPMLGAYRSKVTWQPPIIDKKVHEGPTLLVTRLTLNPDGTLVECGTEGDDPDPVTSRDCERILKGEKGPYLKEMAARYSTFRIASARTPPMYQPRPALKSWGDRLAYRSEVEVMNTEKVTFSCFASKSDGRADVLGSHVLTRPRRQSRTSAARTSGSAS